MHIWTRRDRGSSHKAHSDPSQVGRSPERGKWAGVPIPNPEAISNWRLIVKKKKNQWDFPVGSLLVQESHLRTEVCPAADGKTKQTQWYFWRFFLSYFTLYEHFIFSLLVFCEFVIVPTLCFCGVCLYVCLCLWVCMCLVVFLCFLNFGLFDSVCLFSKERKRPWSWMSGKDLGRRWRREDPNQNVT